MPKGRNITTSKVSYKARIAQDLKYGFVKRLPNGQYIGVVEHGVIPGKTPLRYRKGNISGKPRRGQRDLRYQ